MKQLAKVLRRIGSTECLVKAATLEKQEFKTSTLNLRNLKLKAIDIGEIAKIIQQGKEHNDDALKSLSFSYNPLMGDEGATFIAHSLPKSVSEIGLVGCGIGDNGATEILKWMRNSTELKMICIEGNNFSDNVKRDYQAFKKDHPHIMVVF